MYSEIHVRILGAEFCGGKNGMHLTEDTHIGKRYVRPAIIRKGHGRIQWINYARLETCITTSVASG